MAPFLFCQVTLAFIRLAPNLYSFLFLALLFFRFPNGFCR
jgi:hypothetical protein